MLGEVEGEQSPAVEQPATQPIDYKALLLALLGLDPEATDDAITAKQSEVSGTLGTVSDLQTQASSAADLQTQLDAKNAEVEKAYGDITELRKQQAEAQADEILKVYEGQFTDDASKAAIRAILVSDRESGIAILNGLKKPQAEAPEVADGTPAAAAPPAPVHDPKKSASGATDAELAAQIKTRVAELKKQFPTKAHSALFAQAEKEVRAKAATK